MILLELFYQFFLIGLMSFGGGYAALPLISDRIVSGAGYITAEEFTDVITISQMTPGPIGLNAASFIGTRIYGIPGAICATLGFVAPACIIVTFLAFLYSKYKKVHIIETTLTFLRPTSVGMISAAALSIIVLGFFGTENLYDISLSSFDVTAVIIAAISFVLIRFLKLNSLLVILLSGIAGGIIYSLI